MTSCLTILKMLTTKGNVGTVIEYGGDGVTTLSVPERATIRVGAELGVTTSVFPSDGVTKAFLKAQRRGIGLVGNGSRQGREIRPGDRA